MVLAARNSAWCWPFALVSSALWAYQVWTAYGLLFDAALNVFYAGMAVVGLWAWARGSRAEVAAEIRVAPLREHLQWIAGGLVAAGVCAVLAKAYTTAGLPMLDAVSTVGSVIGTVLLIQRKLANWLYLLAMDVLYVGIYWERGSVLFAGLFVVYCALAVVGYLNWRRLYAAQGPGSVSGV